MAGLQPSFVRGQAVASRQPSGEAVLTENRQAEGVNALPTRREQEGFDEFACGVLSTAQEQLPHGFGAVRFRAVGTAVNRLVRDPVEQTACTRRSEAERMMSADVVTEQYILAQRPGNVSSQR